MEKRTLGKTGEKLSKLKNISCYLLDMDGTLYLKNNVIPGAINFVKKAKEKKKKIVFLSNNSSKNSKQYINKLKRLHIPAKKKEIFTSLTAAIIYLKNKNMLSVYPIGTPGFNKELTLKGIKIDQHHPDAVLLGFDKTITYEKIKIGYKLIKSGVKFIATHPDILCPTENGFIPDTGGFIAMFKKLTGISPKIIGKPYPTMIKYALECYNIKKENTAIIGDRLYTDMKMGKKSGILSILVLSGETKDIKNSPIIPDIVVNNIGELIRYV